ncbi:MAG: hypothetical protein AAF846_07880 [Chloroflexota bacterium]
MSKATKKWSSRTGEFDMVEGEPRLNREPRPTTVPEIDIPKDIGSSTGIMRIRREDDDKTSQGDDNQPIE